MVRGNADRRRELAQQRKEDQKQEALRKKEGASAATFEEVRARLLNDAKKSNQSCKELIAWIGVQDEESTVEVCVSYVRFGSCEKKRCKYKHEFTLCHLEGIDGMNIEYPPTMTKVKPVGLAEVPAASKRVYNRTIRTHVREQSAVVFVEWGGILVYDYLNPLVFVRYVESQSRPLVLDDMKDSEQEAPEDPEHPGSKDQTL
ncbi:hypothetical protein BC833DRAFT_649762 [Globomyces pollinis-pini]|nr:hypothetical protein BC833DRAFT_649762 [Globomyces pollinis-pini]